LEPPHRKKNIKGENIIRAAPRFVHDECPLQSPMLLESKMHLVQNQNNLVDVAEVHRGMGQSPETNNFIGQ